MATILLVEDDQLIADCIMRWLQAAGHTARQASSAQAALDSFDELAPDAILLDIMLHGPNGIQLLHTLRSYADISMIPVIICSSLAMSAEAVEAYGVRAVIDKSTLTRHKLTAAIAGVL